jgi:hypothetical protein
MATISVRINIEGPGAQGQVVLDDISPPGLRLLQLFAQSFNLENQDCHQPTITITTQDTTTKEHNGNH